MRYGLVPREPGEENVSVGSADVCRTKTDAMIQYACACADTTGSTGIVGLKTKYFYWDVIDRVRVN